MNDDELKHALRQWKAPDAPASLERRVLREPWWRWLLTGSVRVPVPALIAAAVLVVSLYAVRTQRLPISCASGVGSMKYVAMVVCHAPSHYSTDSVM
ncbi:MAG: hypothetical protein ABIR70_14130 [Bryobacteraceae bacterium]